ncbi:MAG TPA: MBL fold metallo-hydrolase [Cytophagales bacterium]|nr:MBL fold metallo-hydrolase [Cytophagales bacterium]HAA24236.1 MBL fold metallo-hydrolase [Cytophagales bacterium]HAP59182.1 MBL fold metallo-hydrolase [Cytophagales bacterium]
MKRSILLFTSLLAAQVLVAQNRTEPDTFETECADMMVQPIVHGSLVLQHDSEVIYVDPYGGVEAYIGLPTPTLLLITDIHGDHLHAPTLEALVTRGATLVVPQAVADQLPEKFADYDIVVLDNGKKRKVNTVNIEAIPMYNLPESPDSRHTKGRGNGYLLTICNKRVYISGDTEDIPEMRALEDIDIAFVCMNLPYTMSVDQAADAVIEFSPAVVYPFHYRGQGGLSDVEKFKALVDASEATVDVRLKDWYPAGE